MRPVSRRYRCGVEAHEEDRPKVADRCVSGSRRLHTSLSFLGGGGECWGADFTWWPAVCACARGWVWGAELDRASCCRRIGLEERQVERMERGRDG